MAFVALRVEAEVVTRMVIEDGQRVTAPFVACAEVAFEIHLPQVVGKQMLETLPRSRGTAGLRADAAIAAQDAVNLARRKDDTAVAREDVGISRAAKMQTS